MASETFRIGVVVVRRKLAGPWADHTWAPVAALPAVPETPPWTRLARDESSETFYAGPADLEIHSTETAHYRDNLVGGGRIWIALRSRGGDEVEIAAASVDPYVGEAMADNPGDMVEAVAMPAEIAERISVFFEAHHVEREFYKRKRKRADPEALARRGPGGPGGHGRGGER